MKKTTELWEKELWTQNEVAEYFRVSDNTIKNWRKRGLLSFFSAPGSTRVLYYRKEVEDFQKKYTKGNRKETRKRQKDVVKVKPKLSSDEDWRIC